MILKACSTLAVLILVRSTLACLTSLREYMSSSSHLWIWTGVGASKSTITVLRNIQHAFRLHIFIDWRNIRGRRLRGYTVVLLLETRFLLVANHHLLLSLLHVLRANDVLGTWGTSNWAPNRVALVITWSLAIVTLFLNNILLIGLPIFTLHLFLHLIVLDTALISSIIKASQLFLRLVRSKLAICISLRQNRAYRNTSTHGVNFTLGNQLVGCRSRVIARSTHRSFACLHLSVDRVFILPMHLLLVHQILISKVKVIYSSCWLSIMALGHVPLSVESWELRLVLNEVVLAVLKDRLVAETTDSNYTFAFWFGVFVGVFHFLFSLVHVTGSNGLVIIDLTMEWATEHIFGILDI